MFSNASCSAATPHLAVVLRMCSVWESHLFAHLRVAHGLDQAEPVALLRSNSPVMQAQL
jgi:hypothetical protein